MEVEMVKGEVVRRAKSIYVVALLAALPGTLEAQAVGSVGGRVVDSESGEPVAAVVVTIDGVEPALTGDDGVFVFRAVPSGEHSLVFEHIAYGTLTQGIYVEEGGELALQAVISPQAIELAPLVVETLTELEQRRVYSGSSINEITLPEIERAARVGMNLGQLLDASMPGVTVQPMSGGLLCVQYRAIRTSLDLGDCNGVSVILDGVPVAEPSFLYTTLPLQDIERVEMMSPAQGGVRYGMRTGQSVLLVETKRGQAEQRANLDNLMTGIDWSAEREPYRWLRVFGSSFVANAIGVGIGLALSDRCFITPEVSTIALRTRCAAVTSASIGVLSVALPSFSGSFAARRGGQTERSRGRLVPSMVFAGMVLTGGYLMIIQGDGTSETAGAVVLGLAAPITMTLSDRVFRVLR